MLTELKKQLEEAKSTKVYKFVFAIILYQFQARLAGGIMFSTCLSVCLFVRPSVSLSVHSFITKLWNSILKTSEPILMQTGATAWNAQLWVSGWHISRSRDAKIDNKNSCWQFISKLSHTWQVHITVNANCITTTRMQKVKGEGQSWRPGRGIIRDPIGSTSFFTVCLKKTGPLQLILHNFTNTQHSLIIFGTKIP